MKAPEQDDQYYARLADAQAMVDRERVGTALYRKKLDAPLVPKSAVEKSAPKLMASINAWQSSHSGPSVLILSQLEVEVLLGREFCYIPVWWISVPDWSDEDLAQKGAADLDAFHVWCLVHYPDLYHRRVMARLGTVDRPLDVIVGASNVPHGDTGVLLFVYASSTSCVFVVVRLDDDAMTILQCVCGGAEFNYKPYRMYTDAELEESRKEAESDPDWGGRFVPVAVCRDPRE